MDAINVVADLMALSARTAPKAKGEDCLDIKVATPQERGAIAEEMIVHGSKKGADRKFIRDGRNLQESDGLLLIGLGEHESAGLNCGACGSSCSERVQKKDGAYAGPNCCLRLLDLGIAIGSAVKTASNHNVDNRVMYRVGVIARRLGVMDANVVVGIPLSASGKSIYFDRS